MNHSCLKTFVTAQSQLCFIILSCKCKNKKNSEDYKKINIFIVKMFENRFFRFFVQQIFCHIIKGFSNKVSTNERKKICKLEIMNELVSALSVGRVKRFVSRAKQLLMCFIYINFLARLFASQTKRKAVEILGAREKEKKTNFSISTCEKIFRFKISHLRSMTS